MKLSSLTVLLLALIVFPGCKEIFSYKGSSDGTGAVNLTPNADESFKGIESAILSSDKSYIRLSWTASSMPAEYYIYADAANFDSKNFITKTKETSWDFNDPVPGKTHIFSVQAVYRPNVTDDNRKYLKVPVSGEDKTPPDFAGLVSATATSNSKILLRWNASTSPDIYVYRVYFAGSTQNAIGTIDQTSFIVSGLQANVNYAFIVHAVDASGNEDSNTVTKFAKTYASSPSPTPTPTPTPSPSSSPSPTPTPTPGWSLIFSDEFDGTSVNTTKWNVLPAWTHIINNELQAYTSDSVSVSNGVLSLVARKRDATQAGKLQHYTSGEITTYQKFAPTYGRFEARVKVPSGQGMWPAFWLMPFDASWPPEIDIMEILGHEPNIIHFNNWWPSSNGPKNQGSSWNGPDFSAEFHVLACEWQPTYVAWFVDGVERFRVTQNINNRAMFIIINLAVGGDWPGSPNSSTVFPAYYQIDYVRVYQKQ